MDERELSDQRIYLCHFELESMKQNAKVLQSAFNVLRSEYIEWFQSQSRSFLISLKSIQVLLGELAPQEIRTLRQLRRLFDVSGGGGGGGDQGKGVRRVMSSSSSSDDRVRSFLAFFARFDGLLEDLDRLVLPAVKAATPMDGGGGGGAGAEAVAKEIEGLRSSIAERLAEDFDFTELGSGRGNDLLFTYRLSLADAQFHGLVAFLPGLIQLSVKLCYLVRNLGHL